MTPIDLPVAATTLRAHRRGLIGWSVGISASILSMGAMYPSFASVDFDSVLDQYPEVFADLFNISDMSTGTGFFNAEFFSLMLPVMFVIFATGRGSRLIAGEEADGTLEVIASLPITRTRIAFEKAVGLVCSVAVLAMALFVSLVASSVLFSLEIATLDALRGSVTMFLLGAEFGLIALSLGSATGRRSVAFGVTSGLAGASYVWYVAGQLVDSLSRFVVLSPIHQAISAGPLGPELPLIVWLMPAVGVAALLAALPFFARRDLAL